MKKLLIISVMGLVGCLDWVAPVDQLATPCASDRDCLNEQLFCHRGHCLTRVDNRQCNRDGVVGEGETCDDGNDINTDACTNDCQPAVCGDAIVRTDLSETDEGYEVCDDGNDSSLDDCTAVCSVARCGDGYIQVGVETCDDANAIDTDACRNSCQSARCGDGVVWAREEGCDDGNEVDTDGCTNLCDQARCGDGVIRTDLAPDNPEYERCDDGNLVDADGCLTNCSPTRCGDGIVRTDLAEGEPGFESCDDANEVTTDGCLNTCIAAQCGDGVLRTDLEVSDSEFEACDDGNGETNDGCLNDCTRARCGDGIVRTDLQPGTPGHEACDQGDELSQSCAGCQLGSWASQRAGSCGVRGDGSVWCWGKGGHSMLGKSYHNTPQTVPGLTEVTDLVGDGLSICALRRNGTVWCWGDNQQGQLGDGTNVRRRWLPTQVQGLDQVQTLYSLPGPAFCALRTDRSLWCWGGNASSQLGVGVSGNVFSPRRVVGLDNVVAMAPASVGGVNCAHLEDGTAHCWGSSHARRGSNINENGVPGDRREPGRIEGLSQVVQMAVGSSATCARRDNGEVWCWGSNGYLALGRGDGGVGNIREPSRVVGIADAVDLKANRETFCVRHQDARVSCWGDNRYGQVVREEGAQEAYSTPVVLERLANIRQLVTLGSDFAFCVITQASRVECWGAPENTSVPDGAGLRDVAEIRWFYRRLCVRTHGGVIRCLSNDTDNSRGQSGNNSFDPVEGIVAVHGVDNAAQLMSACVLRTDETVACWGDNRFGRLGIGEPNYGALAWRVPNIDDATSVAVTSGIDPWDHGFGCVLRSDQTVWCWGTARFIHPVNESFPPSPGWGTSHPVIAQNLGATSQISASQGTMCARLSDGLVKCWGSGLYGQAGDGISGYNYLRNNGITHLDGIANAHDIRVGSYVGCALVDTAAWCWGGYLVNVPPNERFFNQLASLPTQVTNPENVALLRVADIGSKPHFSTRTRQVCAVHGDRRQVTCWQLDGEIGSGNNPGGGRTNHPRVEVPGLEGVEDLGMGRGHVCAVLETGAITCWGLNNAGQLGDGTQAARPEPTPVVGLDQHQMVSVSIAGDTSCAKSATGGVWCWGDNTEGQIRDGTLINRSTPVRPTPIELR